MPLNILKLSIAPEESAKGEPNAASAQAAPSELSHGPSSLRTASHEPEHHEMCKALWTAMQKVHKVSTPKQSDEPSNKNLAADAHEAMSVPQRQEQGYPKRRPFAIAAQLGVEIALPRCIAWMIKLIRNVCGLSATEATMNWDSWRACC